MSFRSKFLWLMAIVSLCSATENPIYRRRDLQQARSNRSSHHAQVSINEMVTQIQERVSAMSTMDQTHLSKLDSIENKLTQFDSSTIARLEAIRVQQQEMAKQLQNLDYVQRNTQAAVGDIRNEIDVMRYSMDQKQDQAASHVHARQANFGQVGNETDPFSDKLESLAIFLASTRASVSRIENAVNEFGTSLNKLTQLSRGTHKRLSNLSSRHQPSYNSPVQPQYPHIYNSYGPPPPAFAASEPSGCAQALLAQTGIQKIQLDAQSEPFYVHCESADKGGWTVIQNRFDGSINFNRDWEEYKIGFGNLAGEFFIGMEKLHALTASTLHELMIVLVDFNNETRTARYNSFAVAGEKESYALHILGEYSGTAGDSLSFQAGHKFSTFDNDNDGWVEGNCAQAHTGPWWHAACEMSNLNGQYLSGDVDPSHQFQGMYWNDFHGPLYSLKSVQMKIRPIDQKDAF